MNDQDALLKAIIANADDDTPRLVYADWLDENRPDKVPSPSAGPSARADYIRVQCRLARYPFDDADYADLLYRQDDLADWLNAHTPASEKELDIPEVFGWYGEFDGGEQRNWDRGFPETIEFDDYDDEPEETVANLADNLPDVFVRSTVRSLDLEYAYGNEIEAIMKHECVSGLRGLSITDLDDDDGDAAVRGLAASPHLTGLRRLRLEMPFDDDGLKRLAKAKHLETLESFTFDANSPADLKVLGTAKWFRNLRHLRIWTDGRDALKALAELPTMPNLVSLMFRGGAPPTATAVRRFAASESFPHLARLEIDAGLTSEMVAVLATGTWPLRHLMLEDAAVQKVGAEAIAEAPFAHSLRVLDLRNGRITVGGVQALAESEKLAGLRSLSLAANPIGPGGLLALARSEHLRELRALRLDRCNITKAPLNAAAMTDFLSALEMPELRHLNMHRLPIGIRGARVLAGGTFANLTHLDLTDCGLREKGAREIVESAALPNLVHLDVRHNNAGNGVSKLADPKVFPRLGYANVTSNRLSSKLINRLRKRAGVHTS